MSIARVAENRCFTCFRFPRGFGVFSCNCSCFVRRRMQPFVQLNEEVLHWIRIGWYVDCQGYILDIHPLQNGSRNESQKKMFKHLQIPYKMQQVGVHGGYHIDYIRRGVGLFVCQKARAISKISRAISKISRAISKVSTAISKISRAISKISRAISKISRATSKISTAITKHVDIYIYISIDRQSLYSIERVTSAYLEDQSEVVLWSLHMFWRIPKICCLVRFHPSAKKNLPPPTSLANDY